MLEERNQVDKYKLKLKVTSLFYVAFSVFILLNACIGFSSAPYYERYTNCTEYDVT
jgi:hypothetical protein